MQRRKFLAFAILSGFSWSLAVGCSIGQLATVSNPEASGTVTITVSAAASLQDALDAIAPSFSQTHPSIAIDYNFGSSGALQRQIEQGAPVDVFFSAATKPIDVLEKKGLIQADSRQDLVRNRLVLVAPKVSTLQINSLDQLADADIQRFAVGEFRSVPAGQYAEQVFQELALLDKFQAKFVFGNNVRSVLSAVESGNVDLGMVYATDAALSPQINVLTPVPEEFHAPIVYPVAIIQNTAHTEAAQRFIDFMKTDKAQAIFKEFGFGRV